MGRITGVVSNDELACAQQAQHALHICAVLQALLQCLKHILYGGNCALRELPGGCAQ